MCCGKKKKVKNVPPAPPESQILSEKGVVQEPAKEDSKKAKEDSKKAKEDSGKVVEKKSGKSKDSEEPKQATECTQSDTEIAQDDKTEHTQTCDSTTEELKKPEAVGMDVDDSVKEKSLNLMSHKVGKDVDYNCAVGSNT